MQKMKHSRLGLLFIGFLFSGTVMVSSCKGKSKDESTNTTTTAPATEPTPAPVEISTDDSLKTGVQDATKDYPGVVAVVNNGEITLTGEIERSRLQNLMQSLNSLQPKKINNNLNVK
jgi:hypothetical protein